MDGVFVFKTCYVPSIKSVLYGIYAEGFSIGIPLFTFMTFYSRISMDFEVKRSEYALFLDILA